MQVLFCFFLSTAMHFVRVRKVGVIDGFMTCTAIVTHTLPVKASCAARRAFDKRRAKSYQPRTSRKNPHLAEPGRQTAARSSTKGQTLWRSESRCQGRLNRFDFQMERVHTTYWWWRQTWYRSPRILEVGILFWGAGGREKTEFNWQTLQWL